MSREPCQSNRAAHWLCNDDGAGWRGAEAADLVENRRAVCGLARENATGESERKAAGVEVEA